MGAPVQTCKATMMSLMASPVPFEAAGSVGCEGEVSTTFYFFSRTSPATIMFCFQELPVSSRFPTFLFPSFACLPFRLSISSTWIHLNPVGLFSLDSVSSFHLIRVRS